MRVMYVAVLLSIIAVCVALPATVENIDKERSFLSTWWDWVSSPFTGWGGPEPESQPLPPQTLTILTPIILNQTKVEDKNTTVPLEVQQVQSSTEIVKPDVNLVESSPLVQESEENEDVKPKAARLEKEPNVTISCDEQTCTTTTCPADGGECTNKTCNIYDTNMKGECQVFAHLKMYNNAVAETTKLNDLNSTTSASLLKEENEDKVTNEAGNQHSISRRGLAEDIIADVNERIGKSLNGAGISSGGTYIANSFSPGDGSYSETTTSLKCHNGVCTRKSCVNGKCVKEKCDSNGTNCEEISED